MLYSDWSFDIIQPVVQACIMFVLSLLLAVVVFVIGYLISVAIGRIVTEILKALRFNTLFAKEGWDKALKTANITVHPSEFIGAIVKWVFVIVSLLVSVDILGLAQFGGILT